MVTGAGFKSLKDPVVDGVVVMLVGDMVIGNRANTGSIVCDIVIGIGAKRNR